MKRFLTIAGATLAVALVTVVVLAATVKVDYTGPSGQGDVRWVRKSDSAVLLRLGTTPAMDGVPIGGTTPAAGSFTTIAGSGNTEVGGLADASVAAAAAVTNGQAVALSGLIVQLNSSGSANNYTNTITLSNLAGGANGVFYVINTGTSNLLAIAKTGTWKSAAVEIGLSEMVVITAPVSNAFYGVE